MAPPLVQGPWRTLRRWRSRPTSPSGKPFWQALLASGQTKAQGNVGLAGAAGAEGVMSNTCLRHDDGLAPQGPFTAGKLQHLHLVEFGYCLEVEAVRCPALVCMQTN